MREYRGLTKDGKWVYGYYVFCRHHSYILPIYDEADPSPCFDERWIQKGADDQGWFEVIPKTVGQFTGLKDKKGQEIYEGDIVGEDGYAFLVEFEDGMFRLAHSTALIDWIHNRKRKGIETEVIGNIHENPKLLEAKE